jgi:ferric-dicitrate binding protein FerR (iron transport regulator)
MTNANDYQGFARECLSWAAETDNEEHRQAFREMVKVWTQLAVHGPDVAAPPVAAAPVEV